MVRRGTLESEARTIQHLLTQPYKNPYCESCIRAKMRHYKTHRGAFKRKLKAFGDLVTFDFIDTQRIMDQGIHTDREIFVIRDRYNSQFLWFRGLLSTRVLAKSGQTYLAKQCNWLIWFGQIYLAKQCDWLNLRPLCLPSRDHDP